MSAGTDASMLGYGKFAPLSNINGNFVNVDNSNNPAKFSSNEIPGLPGLPGLAGAKSNVDAAMGKVPGINFKGGSSIKRKIKNITRHYKKMKGGKRRLRSMKKRIRSKISRSKSSRSKSRRTRRQRGGGGYSQYHNNLPMTPSYALGGNLSPNNSALANPPPISVYPNCATCNDNYNHFTGNSFDSRGH